MGDQAIRFYRVRDGYPWTRLGYSFDWSHDKPDRYGVSEFVIRKGATVEVRSIADTADYCSPASPTQ